MTTFDAPEEKDFENIVVKAFFSFSLNVFYFMKDKLSVKRFQFGQS